MFFCLCRYYITWMVFYLSFDFRSTKESIAETAHVVGALERVWSNSVLITKDQLTTLPANRGKIWVFRRCLIGGVIFHSISYKRVIARNDYTIEFQHLDNKLFGSIQTYAKVEQKCQKALCDNQKCCCYLPSIILLLWKFWTKLRISYPNSETGLSLTTSLESRNLAGTVGDTLKKSIYA